jgi:uncharacterized integral membrane protein
MRFFFIVVVLLLVVGFIGFTVTNLGSTATVQLWGAQHPDIPIWQIVILSIAVGAALVGLLATVEGASIRFENRKLRKELQKLEREVNFLRTTQSTATPRAEPDELLPKVAPAPRSTASLSAPASAPVYGERGGWSSGDDLDGDDDDTYTGGSAV